MSNLLEKWFEYKLDKARIKRRLDSIKPQEGVCRSRGGVVRAAAVQRRITHVKRVEAYADIIEGFVKRAAEQNCDIIAFPEYNFFDLLGVLPGFASLSRYLNKRAPNPVPDNKTFEAVPKGLYSLFYNISIPIRNAIEELMCGLALKYHVYIYTGSYFIREEGQLFNGGALISPEGKVILSQKKLHLTDFEEKLGIKRGNEYKVISLDIGNIAFPICMDATYYETFSLARSQGCDIVVLPIANNEEYGLYKALRGIWPRVQESHVYGVKSSLNGWLCGLHFTGKAGIFAPIGITSKKDGVVAIAKHYEGDSLVVGDICLESLHSQREKDEYYGDVNPEFEKNYYINTYGGVMQ